MCINCQNTNAPTSITTHSTFGLEPSLLASPEKEPSAMGRALVRNSEQFDVLAAEISHLESVLEPVMAQEPQRDDTTAASGRQVLGNSPHVTHIATQGEMLQYAIERIRSISRRVEA